MATAIRPLTALTVACRAVLGIAGWLVGLACLLLAMSSWLAEAGSSMFR
ncbi:MAG: hypothetical protein ACYS15_15700 [Planctomycetota bacterium]